MIELELQCAYKHQKPILSVIFDNKYINNQKLLCHECMETFTQDARIIGFKIVNQMVSETQKQKRDFIEILIDNNQKILKSIQLSLAKLKSSIIQELDSLDQIANSWIQNLNNIKSDKTAYSFFEELDKLISYGKEKVSEINKQTIFNEIKETNNLWNVKFINKLNQFNMFQDCLKCKIILQDLTLQDQLICSHIEKQFNQEVTFLQKSDQSNDTQKIHYILILDDSGSMRGDKWDKAKSGALHLINYLQNRNQTSVSVIIYNGDARIVVECQKPNQNEMNKLISFNGGNTSFEPPFRLALELIQKHTNFDKISILFYTDGEAGYPTNIIDQFCKLQEKIRRLINLIACSGEKSSYSLKLIIEKFQQNMQSGELRNSVQPMDLKKVWTDIVSKNIHSQLA